MAVWVEKELCIGCGECIDSCPYNAIEIVDDVAIFNEKCNGCGACVDACDQEAIKTDEKFEEEKAEQ